MTEIKAKKDTLLTKLLEGVKGCQSRFGSRTELATEDDESVRKLCYAFEDVFLHGVKVHPQEKLGRGALWQMTENLVPSGLRLNTGGLMSFWPLIKSQLSKHEAERFLLLHDVRSDFGRARAWLRAALNEHSLERYILMLLSVQELSNFYESWAFLRDPELSSILPQTAAGLGSVLFALVVDNPTLDTTRVMEKAEPYVASPVEVAEAADQFLARTAVDSSDPPAASFTSLSSSPSSTVHKSDKRLTSHSAAAAAKKKKKKAVVNVVSFDEDDDSVSATTSTANVVQNTNFVPSNPTPHVVSDEGTTNLRQFTKEGIDFLERSQNRSSTPNESTAPVQISNSVSRKFNHHDRDDSPNPGSPGPTEISIYSSSVKSVDCISVNSIYSDCSERLDMENLDISTVEISSSQRLKPLRNGSSRISGRNAGSSGENEADLDSTSNDLIPVPNFDSSLAIAPELHLQLDEDLSAELGILSPATPSCSSEATISNRIVEPSMESSNIRDASGTPFTKKNSLTVTPSGLSTGAPISNSLQQLQDERLQKIKAILDREVETVATLQAQLAEEKRKSTDQIKIFEARIESLTKENEILKHQLKKYIGAVQLLKKEGVYRRTTSLEEDPSQEVVVNSEESEMEDPGPNEAAEYERKLIQVAEMHGELMEFNAHLQKSLKRRDGWIRRLREELVDLRGPLAAPLVTGDEEECDEETWDIVDSFSSDGRGRSVRRIVTTGGWSNERVLINIWIPSAFLTGATNDLHHVYQVFVRIKDTEWNVYRRYSQFYSLHRDLKKRDSVIGSYYFPPKKHIGNKDTKFVDERRRKLQEYLRKVINHTLQTNSILSAHPDKNLLISIFPFFGENCFSHPAPKPKRERSRSRNLFFLPSSLTSSSPASASHSASGFQSHVSSAQYPQYTGL